jgi:agmatine deiminase
MRCLFSSVFLLSVFTSNCINAQRVPGEWEPQQATILTWFDKDFYQNMSVDSVHLKMVKSLVKNNEIIINVKNEKHRKHIISVLEKNQVNTNKITFRKADFNFELGNYPRDFGPEWTYDTEQNLRVIDMSWSYYGYLAGKGLFKKALNKPIERYDRRIAKQLGVRILNKTDLVSEGGAKEFNGDGVLMVVEPTELSRNQGYSKEEIDKKYKQLFNLKKVIWLPFPTYEDEHMFMGLIEDEKGDKSVLRSASANGHIDEFCRFVNPTTILLAEVTEEEAQKSELHRINKKRLDACFNILKKETDAFGKLFTIIRMPMPEPLFFDLNDNNEISDRTKSIKKLLNCNLLKDGTDIDKVKDLKILPALSYCNFSIANGVVLSSTYWQEGLPEIIKQKDQKSFDILKKAFPESEVIPINTLAINFNGGGLHCNTRHIPLLKK